MFVVHDEVLERIDLIDEQRDFGTVVLEIDVLAHARAQLLGLAHVDDLARAVFPQVHAGQHRHLIELAFDARDLRSELGGVAARAEVGGQTLGNVAARSERAVDDGPIGLRRAV